MPLVVVDEPKKPKRQKHTIEKQPSPYIPKEQDGKTQQQLKVKKKRGA